MKRLSTLACFFLLFSFIPLLAQQREPLFGQDPCGFPDTTTAFYKAAAAANWGYGYDSLRSDLQRWQASPYVKIDSMGASVQSRTLYLLTIEDTAAVSAPRKRVWVHARTHPNEVQGTWVTNEIIAFLLSETDTARLLRSRCVFNILPMINPDGVELGYPRQNANGIDIESNWATVPGEVEVQALRNKFQQLMAEPNPIEVALNMHSAFACRRYFVYHAASGTSNLFASLEQQFIGLVRGYFPGGIEPWSYFVSWTNNPPPTYYPESWFWYNHRESVMALTYEDMNCPAATAFDSTALALLKGIGDFLGILTSILAEEPGHRQPLTPVLLQNYPNPFNPSTTIVFSLPQAAFTSVAVYSLLGERVALLVNERKEAGTHYAVWHASEVASGVYFYRLQSGAHVETRKMLLLQ